MKTETITGSLKIGDEWNAITIIAKSQAKPLKAVAELVENSLDARAKRVMIHRARSKGEIYLKIIDDGEGIRTGEDGKPDFNYVATHICDSMKKHLEEVQREGVHGEFGIGLLGFWSIGKELHITSRGSDGKMYEMVMKRGQRSYAVERTRRDQLFSASGTEVSILGLPESTKGTLTGEKIQRYLSAELRDRIRSTGVKIKIIDKVSRKTLNVKPRAFRGERIREIRRVPAARNQEVGVELYLTSPKEGENAKVSISRDGTRVINNILNLDEFNREPWTFNRLEGILDFPPLEVAPGNRMGIVPDRNFTEFTDALRSIEGKLIEIVEAKKQAEEERANREIHKDVRRAVSSALTKLELENFALFAIPQGAQLEETEALGLDEDSAEGGEKPNLFPGPMVRIAVFPGICNVSSGGRKKLKARAFDKDKIPILSEVDYTWRLLEGPGILSVDGPDSTLFEAEKEGIVNIEVAGRHRDLERKAIATIIVGGKRLPEDKRPGKARVLPPYETVYEPSEEWRSRYLPSRHVIEVNSGHRDFLASREKPSWFRRYIGKLYAKELVLLNFSDTQADEMLEHLVEMLCWMERSL